MVYHIFLVITCFLQVFAAVIAIKLTRVTKYNLSWILICAGLVTMSVRSIINIIALFIPQFGFETDTPYSWGGIFVSFCFAIGIYLIRKILIHIRVANIKERTYEKRLLKTIIQAEENERKRFATELHDGLGPQLSTIKMSFSAIAKDITDTQIRQNLEQAITEAITTVREISNNLSPHILNTFGLDKAIQNFIGKIPRPQNLNIQCNIKIGDKRYPPTKEIVLYRVLCELINNTLKHAQATNINITIDEQNNTLTLHYEDNGIGFNPQNLDEQQLGQGYYNIISRVTSLKGTAEFNQPQQNGFTAHITIPTDDK